MKDNDTLMLRLKLFTYLHKLLSRSYTNLKYAVDNNDREEFNFLYNQTKEQLTIFVNYIFTIYKQNKAIEFFTQFDTVNPRYNSWQDAFDISIPPQTKRTTSRENINEKISPTK